MAVMRMVGARVKRAEDPRLITGRSTYTDDVRLVDALYAKFHRSPIAHGRVKSVSLDAARRVPGVVAVYTAEDLGEFPEPLPGGGNITGMQVVRRYPLVHDKKVRQVGDPIALVVATSRAAAEDGANAVEVDYEELPAVVDMEAAMKPDAPKLYDDWKNNVAYHLEVGDRAAVDAAMKGAHKVASLRIVNQRLVGNPMETRSVVARWDQGQQELTVWVSSQAPHLAKTFIASSLGLPEHKVRVIVPEVGGGFGVKIDTYGEEIALSRAAMMLGRPVKWTEDRSEHFLATVQGRGQICYIDLAVDQNGKFLALRSRIVADLGAHQQLNTALVPTLANLMLSGAYDIPAIFGEIDAVMTNTPPTGAYRGAGRPEALYMIERVVDVAARELGVDPAELRRRNFIAADRFPFTTKTGVTYDSGNYAPALEKALKLVGYDELRAEQARLRQEGKKLLGIGLSTYVEICGMGPSAAMGGIGWDSATVRFDPTGKVTVLTGVSPHGQGQETTFAQIVHDELGVPFEDVTVLHGDTRVVQYGIGTFGSRGLAVGGAALMRAIERVRNKAKQVAAHLLEASVDDVVYDQGRMYVRGTPSKAVTIQEVAQVCMLGVQRLPQEIEPGLEGQGRFEPTNFTWPFGTHVCVVEIDAETGELQLRKIVAVDDCGKIISPMLVEGQVHGGLAQGIGQALFEGAKWDDSGQPVTGSLMDYAMPLASELCEFQLDHTETPTPVNPLGAKGVGEAGTIGICPAVVNAVVDAISHLGVNDVEMPITSEKIWRILHQGEGR
jgi:carbon-monoxide dehydrogenase large subunit